MGLMPIMIRMTRTAMSFRRTAASALALLLAACSGGHTDTSTSSTGTSTTGTSGTAGSLAFAASTYSVAQNAGTLTVTVNRTGGSTGAVSVAYATAGGTAVAGTNFTAAGGTLSWADGDSAAKTFMVMISNTTPFSGGKTLTVALSGPTGGATVGSPGSATVTINGDAASSVSSINFTAASTTVAQSAGTVTLTVDRGGGTSGAVSVSYATTGGTAVSGTDFTVASGTVEWADGSATPQTFTVAIGKATPFSGTKSFTVTLSNPTGGATLGNPSTATVSIVGSSTASPSGVFGIKVSGNKFVSTLTGNPVQIVGTNISGLENGYKSHWPSFSSAGSAFWSKVVNIDSSGLNTVRLPLNEASWLNYTCYDSGFGESANFYTAASGGGYTPDPGSIYQATVKQAVADATAAGLYVILDLHWGAPNNASAQPLCPIGQPAYADNDHSPTFWKQLADAFKGNPAVIFELFNEPYGTNVYGNWVTQNGSTYMPGPDATRLFTGGNFSPFISLNNAAGDGPVTTTLTWNVASMNSLLQTIRGEGATNVVLASPIGYAGEIETWLGTYTGGGNPDPLKQFGVAWHLYSYAKGTAPPLAVLAAGYPIAVTETFGFDAALDGKKNADGYTWAASEGIGYVWWGWNDWQNQALSTLLNETPWFMSTAP